MVKRSRLEISFEILQVVLRGTSKPTRIMYAVNLSWNTLQEYLTSLIDNDFITEEQFKSSKRYDITEKGENALSYYLKAVEELAYTLKA